MRHNAKHAIHLSKPSLSGEKSTNSDGYVDFGTRVETFGTCVESGRNSKNTQFSAFRNSKIVIFTKTYYSQGEVSQASSFLTASAIFLQLSFWSRDTAAVTRVSRDRTMVLQTEGRLYLPLSRLSVGDLDRIWIASRTLLWNHLLSGSIIVMFWESTLCLLYPISRADPERGSKGSGPPPFSTTL